MSTGTAIVADFNTSTLIRGPWSARPQCYSVSHVCLAVHSKSMRAWYGVDRATLAAYSKCEGFDESSKLTGERQPLIAAAMAIEHMRQDASGAVHYGCRHGASTYGSSLF